MHLECEYFKLCSLVIAYKMRILAMLCHVRWLVCILDGWGDLIDMIVPLDSKM